MQVIQKYFLHHHLLNCAARLSVPREMESRHCKSIPVTWIYGSLQLRRWNGVILATKLEILLLTEAMLK